MKSRRRNPKPPRFEPPTRGETLGAICSIAAELVRRTPWYVWVALVALPAAGYFASPYYQQWAVWDSTFETQVYNMNDERIGILNATRYDNEISIGTAGIFPNSMSNANRDYTNTREVTLFWDFETTNHGHTTIDDITQRTCYYKTLELPERKNGENTLQIGVYDKDVLRIRWGSNWDIAGDVALQKFPASDAWRHGSVPLSSNFNKNDPTNWPEKTTWNEAVDGPAIDAQGAGAWLTVKAERAEPCKENR
jgi:hypothetical protein